MREVYILHNLVYQVMLRKLDLTVGEGLNVDYDVVIEGPLISTVKLESYIRDRLVNFCVAR